MDEEGKRVQEDQLDVSCQSLGERLCQLVLSGEPKGCWFDSQSGHMPRLWARSKKKAVEVELLRLSEGLSGSKEQGRAGSDF